MNSGCRNKLQEYDYKYRYSYCSDMAIANFTENEREMKYEELFCLADINSDVHNRLTSLAVSAVNIFLSVTAFLGNTLILVALHKENSLHPPSKLLFRCLAISDLCVGLVSEPLAVIFWMSTIYKRWNFCRHIFVSLVVTGYILCGMSLLIMTAISVDRLLALSLGLKYRQVVTLKRTYMFLTTLCVISIVFSTMYVKSNEIAVKYIQILTTVCLTTSSVSYTKIFLKLRQRQNEVQEFELSSQSSQLNIARYRKAVSSALWLQLTLVVCYLPNGLVTFLATKSRISPFLSLVNKISLTFVFLNSSLNPLLYFWKMREVRQAVKKTIKQLWCSSA